MIAKRIWRLLLLTLLSALLCLLAPALSAQTVSATDRLQQGRQFYEAGQFRAALSAWEQAERAYVLEQNPTGVAGSRINQAKAWEAIGLYRQACKTLTQALSSDVAVCDSTSEVKPLATPLQDPQLKRSGLRNLGDNLRLMGNLDAAQQVLLQAAQDFPNDRDLWLSLGNVARDLGNRDRDRQGQLSLAVTSPPACLDPAPREAMGEYQRAIACYQAATSLEAQLNHFSLLVEVEQWLHSSGYTAEATEWAAQFQAQAGELRDRLPAQLATLSPNYTHLSAQINFARSLTQWSALHPPFLTPLEVQLQAAIQQAQRLQNPQLEAYAIGNLGKLYEQAGFLPAALTHTQRAVKLISTTPEQDGLYEWDWQQGRILSRQGDRSQAIEAYERAIAALQSVRKQLTGINADAQFSLRDTAEPLYRQYISLLLQSPTQTDLKKAIVAIDQLQLAELENLLGCPVLGGTANVDQVATEADLTAAIVHTIVLDDRIALILKRPGTQELSYYPTLQRRAEVRRVVKQLGDGLRNDALTPELLPPAQQLYSWLIAPIEPVLKSSGAKTLAFVSDSLLRSIPMAVLYDPATEQYLVQKDYHLVLSPQLKLFSPKALDRARLKLFFAGVSATQVKRSNGQPYPPINVQQELTNIQQAKIPVNSPLLDRQVNAANLESRLQSDRVSVIHFLTHGEFSSDGKGTFLAGYDRQIPGDDLGRLIFASSQKGAIELLVLSACRTAQGDNRASLGMTGIAVRAGASSIVSTLWEADQQTNLEFMRQFYAALAEPGTTRAAALHKAQLGLLQGNENNPVKWAPYILVGNWL
jgi:CHAT domain-containing protein